MAEVRNRQTWFASLQRLLQTVNTLNPDVITSGEVKTHLESADRIWSKIDLYHTKILDATVDDDGAKLQQGTLAPMEDCYSEVKAVLYNLNKPSSSSGASSRSKNNIKKPRLELPTFDGKYENWTTFKDTFRASIHNDGGLEGSEKLVYLKSCLKGEAASYVKPFMVTDANYQEAWDLLEKQFDNQREIVHSIIKKLLFQQSMKKESLSSLRSILTTTMECLRSLKVLGRPTDSWDDIVTVLLIDKFDSDTKAEWARSLKGTAVPTFLELQEFMEQQIRTLHAQGSQKQPTSQSKQINVHHTSSVSCQQCKESHHLYQCAKLKEMPTDKRLAAVKALQVCFNCLKEGHSVKECQSTHRCRKCDKKHNTFLHLETQRKNGNSSQPQQQGDGSSGGTTAQPSSNSSTNIRVNSSSVATSTTLLKTAIVDVLDNTMVKTAVRVFIDEGAEGGLIRESCMHALGLSKERVNVTITGVGGTTAARANWKTHLRLFSRVNSKYIDVELLAVSQVTGHINQIQSGNSKRWSHIAGLQLADPQFQQGGEIDILLGSDVAPYIIMQGLKRSNRNSPVAQETIFGWVLFGNVSNTPSQSIIINSCTISETLRKFWELEDVPSKQSLTPEEVECEKHFLHTHTRQPDGRYVVRLPFNEKKSQLGESRNQAHRRLLSLERRFNKHPEYKEAYIEFMREYEKLGHMEKAEGGCSEGNFYLPHHFVLKEESTTTKQRTVFDGSAKSSSGVSLNDALLVGATVQPDLFTLLLRFRYNKVALKADIAKMYRQFSIHEADRDYQRLLWRESSADPIKEYRLTTVTYGTASAPFLATRCLNQLAKDEGESLPSAASALENSTYIDDFLGASSNKQEALNLVSEMIGITARAGMEIRKWCSSDPEVLNNIPEHLREKCTLTDFDDDSGGSSIKALGIKWKPSTDEFLFSVNISSPQNATKRYLLSEIAKTFDPLGWLSPVTVNAKLLLQKVWLAGNDWDGAVSQPIQEEWDNYMLNLKQVDLVKVPRCVISSSPVRMELHGYCDSSELAYACAVYIKCIYADQSSSVNLLTSRTRVAPLKCISLPKLELCGASLLAETIKTVQSSLMQPHTLFCWTDSTITLRWISSHSRKWKTFVANRVSSIQSLVPPEHWHHVRSQDNPADLPSRGIATEQLVTSQLWWHGPSWLQQESYPLSTPPCDDVEVRKEERTKQLLACHLSNNSTHTKLFGAFSSFSKLCRIAVYLLRFISFLQIKKKEVRLGPATAAEIKLAKNQLIRWAQSVSFPEEIHHLKEQSTLAKGKLLQLSPFLDNNGILRVGGRLQNSQFPENRKHPIIVPHDHRISTLIIEDVHRSHLHSGFTLTFSIIRRNFWILRGRDTIRSILRKCIVCRRVKATTTQQLMGNLPAGRGTANRPFLHTGVDFAGPFQVKLKKGRHFNVEKAYFCIYVCLSTKAVHLEAVSSLSSDAFLACYERFTSRRGVSAHIYSDCGTNFVGADRQLKEYLETHQRDFQEEAARVGCTWHFNPPAAPHQGGLWEAGVKAVKFHFNRVVGQRILQLEEFQTLLCKIEACLNSRPLCALSADPNDADALTPGHFLIGEPLTTVPEPDLTAAPENRLKQWESIRHMTQHFWRRWSNEYLSSLQQRFKWKVKRDNLQVGDLVVIADDQMPIARWKLGLITDTHAGSDGLVRSATVKAASGSFKRPITKLSPLIRHDEI